MFHATLSVRLSRPHEPELVGFAKLFTKTLTYISRSVFEQIVNFFLLDKLKINFVDVCIHICQSKISKQKKALRSQ